jgi:hypothetical protein
MVTELIVYTSIIAFVSLLLSPRAKSESYFFLGTSNSGQQPGLITLVLSQVTTWIFARSLMKPM